MNSRDFFQLVERMRASQREYFRTRSGAALRDSKRLEQAVDTEIERVHRILDELRNPKLNFNNSSGQA